MTPEKLSDAEFALMGMTSLAYIKPITTDGEKSFVIHAADGTAIAVVSDLSAALAAVWQNDLMPVALH